MTSASSPGWPLDTGASTDPIDQAYAAELIHRADALHAEAAAVVADLRLAEQLSPLAELHQLGSSITGLMVWRDIDFTASSPGLTPARLWTALHPFLTDPRLVQLTFRDQTGARNSSGDPSGDRFYLVLQLETRSGTVWKIDISFWVAGSKQHQAAASASLRQRLTDETRLAILWIKDIWRHKPEYPLQVGGVDIYRAVLDHGVRSPTDFSGYLVRTGQTIE